MNDNYNLRQAFRRFLRLLEKRRQAFSYRETLAFQAGLRASHAEEAAVDGDVSRAEAHFAALLKILEKLK